MKKVFIILCLFFVSACANSKIAKEPVFIDSNVTADVYSGDRKIGTTPFMEKLSSDEAKYLSVRKQGYKTVNIEIGMHKSYTSNYRPGIFYALSDASSSSCGDHFYSAGGGKDHCSVYLSAITTLIPTYGVGLTVISADLTPAEKYTALEFDQNMFYAEMIPEKKKLFTQSDIEYFKIKTFVLLNHTQIQNKNPEYLETLAVMREKSGLSDKDVFATQNFYEMK